MKRKIVILLACITASICATAQDYVFRQFEASLSIGGPAGMPGSVGGATSYCSVIAEVKYTPILNKWISFSLMGGIHDFHPSTQVIYDTTKEPAPQKEEPKMELAPNLMLMCYINWYTREKFKIYSGVGYGIAAGGVQFRGDRMIPAHGPHFTPVGINFGRRVFGIAELGVGHMYLPLRIGIGYKF